MLIIDRFEDDWAIIEYGRKTFNLPRELVPSEARPGDVIRLSVAMDKQASQKRWVKIEKLADELFEE